MNLLIFLINVYTTFIFDDKYLLTEPIEENLDTQSLLKDFEYGEIRNLYDWIIHKN